MGAQSKYGPGDVKVMEKSAPARGMPSLEPTKAPSPIKDSNDLEFDALIAPKPVVVKPVEKIADEKVMSVKVTSPKAQEMIEDTAEVASKAIDSENLIEESDKPDIENPTVKESKEKPGKKSKDKSEKVSKENETKSKPGKEPKEKSKKETKEKLDKEPKEKPKRNLKKRKCW